MATESMKQLIEDAMHDEDLNEALIDIAEFKLGYLNRFTVEDILVLEEVGFNFVSRSLTQRKQELRTFICGHPVLMSADFETMLDKIMFYLSRTKKEKLRKRQKKHQKTKMIKERYFKDEEYSEQDEPDDAESTHSKSSRKAPKRPKVEEE